MEKENTKPLATDSFSYSWLLTDQKPSSIPPKFFESYDDEHSFDFDVPEITSSSQYYSDFAHADEIFSDGRIMPVYVERRRLEASKTKNSITAPHVSIYSPSSRFVSKNMRSRYYLLGKWRKSSRKILRKCIGLIVRPLVIGSSSRKNSRVDDLDRKVSEATSHRSNSCSPRPSSVSELWACDDEKIDIFCGLEKNIMKSGKSSPNIISPSRSINAAGFEFESHDAEDSIHEAILYCKRSIGNDKRT